MLASDGRQSTNETFDREDSEATTVAGRERMEVGKTASRGGDGSDLVAGQWPTEVLCQGRGPRADMECSVACRRSTRPGYLGVL